MREWVALARSGALPPVDFRQAEIAKAIDHLDRNRSVVLVGPSAVGKTAVLTGVARALAERKTARPIFELSTSDMMAGTRYLGEWQTRVHNITQAIQEAKGVLLVSDIANLPYVGRHDKGDENVFDALRPLLERGALAMIGESTHEAWKLLQRIPGFNRAFELVDIAPMPEPEVEQVIVRAAARRDLELTPESRDALIRLTTRFAAARPQPGPALALLEQVADYREQKRSIGEVEPVTRGFIERVFSINSGLPRFVVSKEVTIPAAEIRGWFSDRIVGQQDAIEAVVDTIALFKASLHDPSKPIGTFLFVGPTGVGKTEVARCLAEFLFGSPQRLLRFDLSEFKDYSSFEMLLGNPARPDKPARLVDPVRLQPFQVVLLDELEKAHPNVWDLLLPLLDEGRLTTPAGETVNFRNTILIATSNVGAAEKNRMVGFGTSGGSPDQEAHTRQALEREFRPELLNRFHQIVVFHSLTQAHLREVARHEVTRVMTREGLRSENIVVDVDDAALDLVIAEGVDARYGARALKREVQRRLVLPIAMTLMEQGVERGSILRVDAKDGAVRVRAIETEESRSERKEHLPARAPDGTIVDHGEIARRIEGAAATIDDIAKTVDIQALREAKDKWMASRNEPNYWKDVEVAEHVQEQLQSVELTIFRIERLSASVAGLRDALQRAQGRTALESIARRLLQLTKFLGDAKRELCVLRWEGSHDALLYVGPVGTTGCEARDRLARMYEDWAIHRQWVVDCLHEPRADDEPVLIGLKGTYAYGMSRLEAGMHRFRTGENANGGVSVASVRVAAWKGPKSAPKILEERPLKGAGQRGQKLRSRLVCVDSRAPNGTRLVLQNARTLAANRELAAELVGSWSAVEPAPETIVRRYDLQPPLLRDVLTDFSSGRPDATAPENLDLLLKLRIDANAPT
jgi:ATP-dependent Clp protease ATP-binding subunit ClpC